MPYSAIIAFNTHRILLAHIVNLAFKSINESRSIIRSNTSKRNTELNQSLFQSLHGSQIPLTNDIWSVDFMHDQMSDGKNYRLLNIIDDDKREGLSMEVGVSTPILSVTIGP